MSIAALRPAVVLSVWTMVVWTTRIRNIWTDDSLTTSGQLWRTAISLVFTAFAAVTIAAWVRGRRNGGSVIPCTALWIRAFAIWTGGVWIVRAAQIATADHGLAFKIVHSVLALVSVGLALWADRAATRAPRPVPVSG